MADTDFVDNSTVVQASWLDDVNTSTYSSLTGVAGTNTITAGGPATMTAYATGQRFVFVPANSITGPATINITPSGASALGAKNIFARGVACRGSEIQAGVSCLIAYDGTQFNIIGPEFNTVNMQTETGATGTVAAPDAAVICNRAGTVTLTLPSAVGKAGRLIYVKTIQAQAVVSDASNVVPIDSASSGTALLPATDGAWAILISDDSNWVIMARG